MSKHGGHDGKGQEQVVGLEQGSDFWMAVDRINLCGDDDPPTNHPLPFPFPLQTP